MPGMVFGHGIASASWMMVLVGCGQGDTGEAPAEPIEWPITIGGDRPVEVIGPEGWTGEDPLPVVLLLHGFGASGILQDALLRMSSRVEPDQFLLVRPDGTPNVDGLRFWNATDDCCDFYGQGVDDVAYLSGLVDELAATVAVDSGQVYATGHSNGGYMSYRLACDRGDRFAAIAPLAGAMWKDPANCPAADAVSVLHIHGDGDPDVPYEGDESAAGAFESTAFWAGVDGCDGTAEETGALDLIEGSAGDETVVHRYPGCRDGLGVEMWTMVGTGHVPIVSDAYAEQVVAWLYAHAR